MSAWAPTGSASQGSSTLRHFAGYYRDQIIDDPFVVLTGVDVVPDDASGDANGSMGEVQLRMIKYESKLASGAIESVLNNLDLAFNSIC